MVKFPPLAFFSLPDVSALWPLPENCTGRSGSDFRTKMFRAISRHVSSYGWQLQVHFLEICVTPPFFSFFFCKVEVFSCSIDLSRSKSRNLDFLWAFFLWVFTEEILSVQIPPPPNNHQKPEFPVVTVPSAKAERCWCFFLFLFFCPFASLTLY